VLGARDYRATQTQTIHLEDYAMTSRRKLMVGTIVTLVYVLSAATAGAQQNQEGNLWGVDADVDRDGQVSATDVQHVINRALGVDETDPTVPIQVRQYVVASPRAALTVLRPCAEAADCYCCETVGGAYNFPRQDGRIIVRRGTVVVFRLDRNIEGVWYPRACGWLGTQIVLEMQTITSDGEVEWVVLGRDAAAAERCGPMAGRANVGVRHAFQRPGRYLMRAKVWTFALPTCGPTDDALDAPDTNCPGAVRAYDEIYVLVRVPEGPITPEDIEWQEIPEPIMREYGEPMPHEVFDIDELEAIGDEPVSATPQPVDRAPAPTAAP